MIATTDGVLLWMADHLYVAPLLAVLIWAVGEIALSHRLTRKHVVAPAAPIATPAALPNKPPPPDASAPRALIAKAALLTAVVSRSESERIAVAVLAALEDAEIVLATWRGGDSPIRVNTAGGLPPTTQRMLVPLESLPESEK